ncbi:unnamed protein product [Spirodela intermedia]|uniref:Uncharacterized protein n=1 Tax=Spirodela intermedia TaxID=51605 RepID=A0A7I8JUD0_SPIIN|nr:unnamed protein product [Spirodela intermedia]CAA6673223.1 unnamed protein product [Spirodela intermedia]
METTKSDPFDGSGSVTAAISLFGERIHGGKPLAAKHKPLFPDESPPSKTRELLHLVRRDAGRLGERLRFSEHEKSVAESELISSKETMNELRTLLENSSRKVRSARRMLTKPAGDRSKSGGSAAAAEYDELVKQLERMKKERSKVRLDIARAGEDTAKAEEEAEAAVLRSESCLNSIEELRKEVDAMNEEHVLVEIARLQAVEETREFEARRAAEAAQFGKKIQAIRDRMMAMRREIDLAASQSEIAMVRPAARDSGDGGSAATDEVEKKRRKSELERELLAAKQELVSTKDEGFQLMASMDMVRLELVQISRETSRLKKLEEKQDSALQNLNSKLLRAKSKLETAAASEEKSRSIVLNLSAALQQLRTEARAMRKEKDRAEEEIEATKTKIQSADAALESAEQRLEDAIEALKSAKASEASSLGRLKHLSERTMKFRACSAPRSSTMTMSTFEYEYLKGQAEGAQKIAEKKVAAARAWIDAFKVSEEEILLKIDRARREMGELEAAETRERGRDRMEETLQGELSGTGGRGEGGGGDGHGGGGGPVAGGRRPEEIAERERERVSAAEVQDGAKVVPLPWSPPVPSVTLRRAEEEEEGHARPG